MISATAEPQSAGKSNPPQRRRMRLGLWAAVVFVFVAQVALVFWLGNPPPVKPATPSPGPVIRMSGESSRELLAVEDPTLFVLPHRDNFSGEAWLKTPSQSFPTTNWSEPARPLELPIEQLGATFMAFMQTNVPPQFQPELDSALDPGMQSPPMPSISTPSTLVVEGDLARLRLLTPLYLPPQTNSDLLTNTVVRLVVDAIGRPFSEVISSGCGKPEADTNALMFAKMLRFAPAEAPAFGVIPPDTITLGKVVFEWQTIPPAPTNAPSTAP